MLDTMTGPNSSLPQLPDRGQVKVYYSTIRANTYGELSGKDTKTPCTVE